MILSRAVSVLINHFTPSSGALIDALPWWKSPPYRSAIPYNKWQEQR